jgi:hypothetical protein
MILQRLPTANTKSSLHLYPWYTSIDHFATTSALSGQLVDSDNFSTVSEVWDKECMFSR